MLPSFFSEILLCSPSDGHRWQWYSPEIRWQRSPVGSHESCWLSNSSSSHWWVENTQYLTEGIHIDQPCVKDVMRVTFTFFSLLVKLELWMLATDQASPPRNSNHSMSFTCWELWVKWVCALCHRLLLLSCRRQRIWRYLTTVSWFIKVRWFSFLSSPFIYST